MKIQTRVRFIFITCLLLSAQRPALAALHVFACEPEWGALAQELGGDKVSVYNATTALQDPHQVQARPSLLAQVRKADLVVCTGAELEIGWLPLLLRQGGNDKVQPGKPGNFAAAESVRALEVPTRLDRSEGDVHPYGNPHIQTDPRNIAKVAQALATRLAEVDAAQATFYAARYQAFATRWQQAIARWEQQAAPLRGMPIVVQHKGWIYLQDWLGFTEVATLEPKPGIPPSSGYLASVLEQLRQQPARMVIRAAYQDAHASDWLSKQTGIAAVELPFPVGGTDGAQDLYGLFDDTLARLLSALK
ncbi:MAG: zinc ABC transporter substrate-binding protein [Gammaproteobacteria bacterium]|nr:zinc ABC transporter substrate-binding protein [Gammaproteobacteria bacterium]